MAYCDQTSIQYATGLIKEERPITVIIRKLPIDINFQGSKYKLTEFEYKPGKIKRKDKSLEQSFDTALPFIFRKLTSN